MTTTLTLTQDIFIGGVRQAAGSVITVNDSFAGALISENKAIRPADFGLDFNKRIEFIPESNDSAGIQTALNAAIANGGGTVKFLPITYTLTQPITLADNITFEGSGCGFDMNTSEITGGTILDCVTGTFNCFKSKRNFLLGKI